MTCIILLWVSGDVGGNSVTLTQTRDLTKFVNVFCFYDLHQNFSFYTEFSQRIRPNFPFRPRKNPWGYLSPDCIQYWVDITDRNWQVVERNYVLSSLLKRAGWCKKLPAIICIAVTVTPRLVRTAMPCQGTVGPWSEKCEYGEVCGLQENGKGQSNLKFIFHFSYKEKT